MATKKQNNAAEAGTAARSPSLLRNAFSLLTGRLIGDLATFLLFVVLSRHFGEEGIGEYSFATVIGGLGMIAADFGLRSYTMKEVGRHRDAARDLYWHLAASWLLNVGIVFLLLVPVVILMPLGPEAKAVLALICTSQLFLCLVSSAASLFVAHERMELGACFESGASWLVAVSAITVTFLDGSLVAVAGTIAIAYGVASVVAGVVVFRYFHIRPQGFSPATYINLLREAVPFALRQILRQVTIRMDVIFIGVLLGPVAVGAYAVAYRLIFLLYIFFNLVGHAIIPASSRLYKEAPDAFSLLAQRALGVVVLISVPAAVGLAMVAPAAIGLIFGPAFTTSIGLLEELSILIAIFPVGLLMQNLLTTSDRQVFTMYTEVVGVVTGLVAHSCLIPPFGLTGAVAAAVLTEVAVVIAAAYGVRDIVDWQRLSGRLMVALLGSAGIAGLYLLLPDVLPLLLILPAVVIYGAVLFCFSDLRREELSALVGLLRRRRSAV